MIRGKLAFVRWDRHPVNPGHALVIPYRHVSGYFDATDAEKWEIWELVDKARVIIDREHNPDGYNVGVNVGEVAGQSIMHLHVHVIPRYRGDVSDPKGGVRAVIPQRKKYELIP